MDFFIPTKLKERVKNWREEGYPSNYPILSEILDYNLYEDEFGNKNLRYLRKAQFEALETYWYLRVIEKTPHIFELYKKLYDNPKEMFSALGIILNSEIWQEIALSGKGTNYIIEKIKTDDVFVKQNKLEAVRESLTLDYPSYIFALAMGAGKTVLIGTIICTEFSLAIEYKNDFVKNALVFAPGKTILGALKEISDIPFDKILPLRLYKQFMSSVKITYTQDKEKDIPIIRGSSYNIIVTNTEKIRIQKSTGKSTQLSLFNYKEKEKIEDAQETANLRLQTISSLPHLAIFSDEAHHTYGQSLDDELKKVRKTVDYLAENTNVIAVINTTGTPYYKKQMLRDVVFWYGLSQGIKDGILKDVKDGIYSYDTDSLTDFVNIIIEDFFKEYRDVTIYTGAKSKIAIYFPQTDDVKKIKPIIEKKILELGLDSSIVLEVNNKSEDKIKDLFNNRINDPTNPYRVFLLVNMGTEGWNCPSLFATALARKLKSSNNFILQSATRCLRQVPNNNKRARIYLSEDNRKILDYQLKETFGESLQILDMTKPELRKERLILRKIEIPPILVKKKVQKIILENEGDSKFILNKPTIKYEIMKKKEYSLKDRTDKNSVLVQENVEEIKIEEEFCDLYSASIDLSQIYRLDLGNVYDILRKLYNDSEIPANHIIELKKQIESQLRNYKIIEEEIEVHLALIKKEGFNKEEENGAIIYTAEIMYHKNKENLLLYYKQFKDKNKQEFGFHYSPYKMDSNPEKDLFVQLLDSLNENPDDIEDIYYIGQLTDIKKTDFLFEYKDKNGKWRNYTPDFVIKKKDGRILIIEVKAETFRDENKEMAIRKIENLNPDKLKYKILLTNNEEIGFENIKKVKGWIYGCKDE